MNYVSKLMAVALAVGGAIGAAWFFSAEAPEEMLKKTPQQTSTQMKPREKLHVNDRADIPIDSCKDDTLGLAAAPIRPVLNASSNSDQWMEAVTNSREDVVRQAKAGIAPAALAYFKSVMSCLPASSKTDQRNICSSVAKADAFNILERSARGGDIEAQTIFAMNAPVFSAALYRSQTNEGVARAAELIKLSELFGAEAARGGSEEAMTFMARAYLTGQFGVRDLEKSYYYLLPLARHAPSAAVEEIVTSVASRLSPSSKKTIEDAALGCRRHVDIVNPFLTTKQ